LNGILIESRLSSVASGLPGLWLLAWFSSRNSLVPLIVVIVVIVVTK
jgi:hypothetical protein